MISLTTYQTITSGEPLASRSTILIEEPLSVTNLNSEKSSSAPQPTFEMFRNANGPVLSDDSGSSTGSMASFADLDADSDSDCAPEKPQRPTIQPVGLPTSAETGSGHRAVTETPIAGPSQPKASRKIEDVLTPLPMQAITQAALDHLQRVGSRWPLLTDDRD